MSDRFRNLHYVFEMQEKAFFNRYVEDFSSTPANYKSAYAFFTEQTQNILDHIPELPFSHIWIAQKFANQMPLNAKLFLGILHSLRSWNFSPLPDSVVCYSNVGGFGIDGGTSSFLGASLVHRGKIYFLMTGDLAFFYDLNALGNRNLGNNCRIMLVNNGRGTEFRNYSHPAQQIFSDKADTFMAAAGHYGRQSHELIRHFAEDLGFIYMSASNKNEFCKAANQFFSRESATRPMLLEVFTNPKDESDALHAICNVMEGSVSTKVKKVVSSYLSDENKRIIKKIIRRN